MNFWEWFQCLYVILTFTNVLKPSEYNFNNSFVSTIASVHQSLELPKFAIDFGHLNCIFATAAMIFATRFLKDDLEYILRTERFLVYSCRNIFSPEGCLLRSSVNKCGSRFKTTTIYTDGSSQEKKIDAPLMQF